MTSYFCKHNYRAVFLLLLLLLTTPAPTTAQTPHPDGLPLGFHIGRGDSAHMEAVRAAGGSFAVVVFSWADIEPEPNYLYWEMPDAALRAAEFYGIELLARLDQPPDWALDAGNPTPWNPDAYANFTRRVTERYGNRLAGIILWNEPNLNLEWNNQPPDAAAFAELLKTAYPAAKSAAPELPVLLGGPAPTEGEGDWAVNDLDYLQALYAAGAGDYFDILTAHPYGFGRPPDDAPEKYRPNFRRLELYRQIMDANGDSNKAVWVTELGWLTHTDNPKSEWQVISPETQAEYILGAIDYAAANYPWLKKLGIWQLNTAGDEYGFGIWHGAGESSPAYEALVERAREQGSRGAGENGGQFPVEILAADATIRLGDRATLHPHWVHLYRGGYKFSPAWQGEFFLSDEQAGQRFDLLIETMQVTQPTNRLHLNGAEIAALRPRARPDITSTWVTQRFAIPPGLLAAGPNSISLRVGPRNPARQYVTAHWENMQFRHIRLVPAEKPLPPLVGDWQRQPTPGGWSESNRLRRAPNGQIWLTGNRPGQVWQLDTAAPGIPLKNQSGSRPDLLFHDILSMPQGDMAATRHGLFRRSSPQSGWIPIETAPAEHAYVVQQANGQLFAGFEGIGLWQAPAPDGPWRQTALTATTVVDLVRLPQAEQPDQLYAVAKNAIFFNDGIGKTWASLPLPGLTAEALQDAGEFAGDKLSPRLFPTNDGRLLLRHQDRFWVEPGPQGRKGAGSQVAGPQGEKDARNTQHATHSTQQWQLFGPEHLRGKLWSAANCCGAGTVVGTYRAGVWQLAEDGRWQRIDGEFFSGADVSTLLQVDDTLVAAGDLGLFASSGGEAWQAVSGLPPVVSDLLVDPAEAARWVAGTPAGVYLSRDAGESWQAISPPWTVWDMAFGPQGRLFAGRSGGMVWTDDLAADPVSWQVAEGMKQVYFLSVNPHPIEPDLVWSGTWGNNIAFSNDGGLNIDPLHNGLETLSGLDILWHPAPGQVTLATIEGLYRTDDGGQSWFKLPGLLRHQTVYALFQTENGTMWAGAANGLWKSGDYGSTWEPVADVPPAAVLRLGSLAGPERAWLWAGTEGAGLWISRDAGKTWEFAGLPERTIYNFLADPLQPGRWVAATDAGIFANQ